MVNLNNENLFSNELQEEIRAKFAFVDTDPLHGKRRLFFDNAGGSFRLKSANEGLSQLDLIPNCPMRDHEYCRLDTKK